MLRCEYEEGPFTKPPYFDYNEAWREATDLDERFGLKNSVAKLKSLELRLLHVFIGTNLYGRAGSFSTVSKEDMWLLTLAMHGARFNTAKFMIERIKAVAFSSRAQLAYGNILTRLLRRKGIWGTRYQNDLKFSSHIPFNTSSLQKMHYYQLGAEWIKQIVRTTRSIHRHIIDEQHPLPEEPREEVQEEETEEEPQRGQETTKLNEILSVLQRLELGQQRMESGQQRLEESQQVIMMRLGSLENRFESFSGQFGQQFFDIGDLPQEHPLRSQQSGGQGGFQGEEEAMGGQEEEQTAEQAAESGVEAALRNLQGTLGFMPPTETQPTQPTQAQPPPTQPPPSVQYKRRRWRP